MLWSGSSEHAITMVTPAAEYHCSPGSGAWGDRSRTLPANSWIVPPGHRSAPLSVETPPGSDGPRSATVDQSPGQATAPPARDVPTMGTPRNYCSAPMSMTARATSGNAFDGRPVHTASCYPYAVATGRGHGGCRFRPTVTWPVLRSVVLHGISASPLATLYGGYVATLGDVPEKALVSEPRIRLRDLAGRQRPEAQPR